jgi:hypothetical protein
MQENRNLKGIKGSVKGEWNRPNTSVAFNGFPEQSLAKFKSPGIYKSGSLAVQRPMLAS